MPRRHSSTSTTSVGRYGPRRPHLCRQDRPVEVVELPTGRAGAASAPTFPAAMEAIKRELLTGMTRVSARPTRARKILRCNSLRDSA